MKVWQILHTSRFGFSHRTAQETADYIFISHMICEKHTDILGNKPSWEELTDLAFLQKVLPKINGSSETLRTMQPVTDQKALAKDISLLDALIDEFKQEPVMNVCIRKLEEMKVTLDREHFVSFIQ